MKKTRPSVLLLALFVSVSLSTRVRADTRNPFKARCDNDHMVPGAQIGRNAWAHKCGYLSATERDFQSAYGYYVTFLEKVAPLDVNAPCEAGLTPIGLCAAAGCYTPGQQVHFGLRGYLPIGNAAMESVDTVSGFAPSWTLGESIALSEEKVGSYTVGDQFSGILVITTQSGKRIEVTDNHPLVNSEGQVLQASEVVSGVSQMLTVDGPEIVSSVQDMPYVGKVWNVEPESTRTKANLHLAEGFVSGSVRYQNEWADDAYRRSLRDHVNTDNF